MAEPKTSAENNEIKWELAPGFKDSWKKYLKTNSGIKEAMREFDRCKRAVPPIQLPGKMKDHKLDGPLKGYYDCHLDDDVILIYKPIGNGGYKLFRLCEHADLKGPKARILVSHLK
ncbi:type II toxin-antitoxin system mRNA interferase toxin, RelE/StbE family [Methylocapsa polymorpha]|uniref:Type II toxin-antitoxin system mRNA interferase toxin, RelE/StbE family n=1 Tax=Methylocapsa polymorpha TaxID=3080828 RepID=A0ABZ0HN98_9HYPH|nr:type II toxin-antitoxin system mRNA interferase toxin, RelE/StbE family [Methylocapsa sp. RX1]